MKLKKKNNNNLHIGDIVYSDYTRKYYIVASLPRIIKDEKDTTIALVRLDGCGYFYLSDSLEELKNKMKTDGGETEAFEVVDYDIKQIEKLS